MARAMRGTADSLSYGGSNTGEANKRPGTGTGGLTFTFGEAPASVADDERRGCDGTADDRGVRQAEPAVAEGTAAVRRAGAAAARPGRPGHRLPVLHREPVGAGPARGLAAAARDAAGRDTRRVRAAAGRGRAGDRRVLGAGRGGDGRTAGPRRVPRRGADRRTGKGPHDHAGTSALGAHRPRAGAPGQPGHRVRGPQAARRRRRVRPGGPVRERRRGGGAALPGRGGGAARGRAAGRPGGRGAPRGRGGTGPDGRRARRRHHADRPAVDRVPAGPRAHRGLAGVSAARRRAVPVHPGPPRRTPLAAAAQGADRRRRPGAGPAPPRAAAGRPVPAVFGRADGGGARRADRGAAERRRGRRGHGAGAGGRGPRGGRPRQRDLRGRRRHRARPGARRGRTTGHPRGAGGVGRTQMVPRAKESAACPPSFPP
ncbi:hypothetical protein SGPA1_30815 [Streptomyces misionensis JCM 4497]